MAVLNQQAVLGFLNRDEIQDRLDSGELTSYSVVFTKDTLETVVVDENKELIDIKSRVFVFDSVMEALEKLNASSSTYEGQLVAIRVDDTYRGHIVNKSESGFYVTDLCNNPKTVNYDTLNNIPIRNLQSDPANPIILSDLDDGTYKITGIFVCPDGKKVKSIVGNLVTIQTIEWLEEKRIKRIGDSNIFDYAITASGVETYEYVTDKYLEENGYITSDGVDKKIEALHLVTKEDMQKYVYETCMLLVDHLIDEKIPEHIKEASEDEIEDLFE